jgi:hypothetical protein
MSVSTFYYQSVLRVEIVNVHNDGEDLSVTFLQDSLSSDAAPVLRDFFCSYLGM